MPVYVSYTDESQSADQKSGKFLIAGYVANKDKWPEFSKRWHEEVISSKPSIPYLHMVDIRSESWRIRNGLTRAEADEKVRRAITIIAQSDYIDGYCTHVSEHAYNKLLYVMESNDSAMAAKSRVDYLCFGAYAGVLIKKLAGEHLDLQKVIFSISRKKGVSHHLEHSFHDAIQEMLEQRHPDKASFLGDVLALNMPDHMPLQAADVLCWHLQRRFNKLKPADPDTMKNIETLLKTGIRDVSVPDSFFDTVAESYLKFKRQEKDEK